jgi:predicted Rossmann-fold nucleotide-binding protein
MVIGSDRFPLDHPYCLLACEMGRRLAEEGYAVMTGGGPGIMEAANRGAKDGGEYPEDLALAMITDLVDEAIDIIKRSV